MYKYDIVKKIEDFAPLNTQEEWDCSGWAVDVKGYDDVNKIMLCLTVSEDVICQAKNANCDMIISHHPLFYVPLSWSDINICSFHTNLDKACGGTTDRIIEVLGLNEYRVSCEHDFLRLVEYKTTIEDYSNKIRKISPNARVVNNKGVKEFNKIAFCAGSGSEFIFDAQNLGAEALVTGDIKFHTALDSELVLYDIGHFESEILILPMLKNLIYTGVEVIYAREKSPFEQI